MSNPTIAGRMRAYAIPYFVFLTVLWVLLLRVADLLPKEGELIPRGGAWREATQADRIQSFLWLTFCWYFGAVMAFGMMWRMAEIIYGLAFESEPRD
jgi:fucose 4-O-acetylase-like acetyltransferase